MDISKIKPGQIYLQTISIRGERMSKKGEIVKILNVSKENIAVLYTKKYRTEDIPVLLFGLCFEYVPKLKAKLLYGI